MNKSFNQYSKPLLKIEMKAHLLKRAVYLMIKTYKSCCVLWFHCIITNTYEDEEDKVLVRTYKQISGRS